MRINFTVHTCENKIYSCEKVCENNLFSQVLTRLKRILISRSCDFQRARVTNPGGSANFWSVPAKIWSFIFNCSMVRQRKESSEPTRKDPSDQEIYENNEMYETTVNEEKQMMSNKPRNLCVIESQIPTCSKYTTGWNFDPSFKTNNTSTLIKEHICHLCDRMCKTQSGLTLQSWTYVSGHLRNMAKSACSRTCQKCLFSIC